MERKSFLFSLTKKIKGMFAFNNRQKICLTWALPRQIKPSYLKTKFFLSAKFLKEKTILLIQKIGRVDKLTALRHLVLTLYGYPFCTILLKFFDPLIAIIIMSVFQTINMSIFLRFSRKSQKEGILLYLASLIFDKGLLRWLLYLISGGKRFPKLMSLIKMICLFILEPFLFLFLYRTENHYYYLVNKKVTVASLTVICSILASITWTWFFSRSGLYGKTWEVMINMWEVLVNLF